MLCDAKGQFAGSEDVNWLVKMYCELSVNIVRKVSPAVFGRMAGTVSEANAQFIILILMLPEFPLPFELPSED